MANESFKYFQDRINFFFCLLIFVLLPAVFCRELSSCLNSSFTCIDISQCNVDQDESTGFVYPCQGTSLLTNKICCPISAPQITTLLVRKKSLLPENCGIVTTSDKISGGNTADLGQFPWMVLLGYKQNGVADVLQFLCGGSVIMEKYILTAAHCMNVPNFQLTIVRLGELDLATKIDCVNYGKNKVCADPYVDNPVEKVLSHPSYNEITFHNDIALVRVKETIRFTEYIRPICLPFDRGLEGKNFAKEKFIVSGWGKTKASNLGNSQTLQYAPVYVWSQALCKESVPPLAKPIKYSQMCVGGNRTEDACKGDSGGPLVNGTVGRDKEVRYFQVGIVSFAAAMTCGDPSVATVYTRVDSYLSWILENIY